jgi:TonB family protein
MSILPSVLGIVLATSSVVFAQTSETKPPNVGVSGVNSNQSATTPSPNPCGSGALDQAEILTDTMGVDFGPYLTGMVRIVRKNWYTLMPPSVYPPHLKQGKVSIEFVVLKNGAVSGMKVRSASGDVGLDRAAWGSITASTPFAALPAEFPGERLGLRFYFFYNRRARYSIDKYFTVR